MSICITLEENPFRTLQFQQQKSTKYNAKTPYQPMLCSYGPQCHPNPPVPGSFTHLFATNDQKIPVVGRDVLGSCFIGRLVDTWLVRSAFTVALNHFVDRKLNIKLLLATNANAAVARILLNFAVTRTLVASALGLAPNMEHSISVPNLVAPFRSAFPPSGRSRSKSLLGRYL